MSQLSFSSWIRQPASIVLIIAMVIMFIMLTDETGKPEAMNANTAGKTSSVMPGISVPREVMTPPGNTEAKAPRITGGELPKIVQRLGAPPLASKPKTSEPGPLTAPDLGSLLGRLEDKVKAEPDNINNRLLLAQTYNELGLIDKALEGVRAAIAQFPDHSRAKLVLASILSKRTNEPDLKEAIGLLKGLREDKSSKQYLVEMYLGDAWIRMGEHKSALQSWKLALEGMPVSDNRRTILEKGIADLNAGKPGA